MQPPTEGRACGQMGSRCVGWLFPTPQLTIGLPTIILPCPLAAAAPAEQQSLAAEAKAEAEAMVVQLQQQLKAVSAERDAAKAIATRLSAELEVRV